MDITNIVETLKEFQQQRGDVGFCYWVQSSNY